MSSAELDGFGPWIRVVRTADEMPRLFRTAGIQPEDCRLVLKLPRSIERRSATAQMDLYDHVVAVGEELLTVLSRQDFGYDTIRVPFDQIVAIEDSVCLLDGRLTLHVGGGVSVVIPYNGSSRGPILDLTGLLRRNYLPFAPEPSPDGGRTTPYLGGVDPGLINAYHRIVAREPGMRLVSAVGRRRLHRSRPVRLQGSIVLTDGREVLLIHRRDWFSGGGGDYSVVMTVLPLLRVRTAEVRPHPRYPGICLVTVWVEHNCLRFPVPDGPELDAFLAILGCLPARRA
jgi:hypothetical protein